MADLNYATSYQQALDQAYPYSLYYGALYATPNNGRYKWTGARTIEVPTISVKGRVDADRDTIGTAVRNYDNTWTPLTIDRFRKWSTLVHPMDIDETNFNTTIANITRTYNEEQKFPEMDAYTISKIYADAVAAGAVFDSTALTADNVIEVYNKLMTNMSNKRVPATGRILYVTPDTKNLIQQAKAFSRQMDVKASSKKIVTDVETIDLVTIETVPPELMQTAYDFTQGWTPGAAAKQINMFLVHPNSVITPVKYNFARLDEPSAGSEGKYVYYEESEEDVFILKNKLAGIQMNGNFQ